MKNCKKINIRDKINLMYIYLFFSIGYNIFMNLVCIMSSIFKVIKDRFYAQLNSILLQSSETMDNNDKNTNLLVICKYRQDITDVERKAVQDYYFDPANSKLVYKHIQECFL